MIAIAAPSAVCEEIVLEMVTGTAAEPGTGIEAGADPLGASPGVPYFHVFSAPRSVCAATIAAAVRFRPGAKLDVAEAKIAISSAPAQSETIATTAIASSRTNPRCGFTPR